MVMSIDLFNETLDELTDFVVSKIESEPTTTVPSFVVTASPNQRGEKPFSAFWLVVGEFVNNERYTIMHKLGEQIGLTGIQLSAVFVISQAMTITQEEMAKIPKDEDYRLSPAAREAVAVIGTDIDGVFCQSIVYVKRDMDTNAINVQEVKKGYAEEGVKVKSDLLEVLMDGYIDGVHQYKYGAKLDRKNPFKYINPVNIGS